MCDHVELAQRQNCSTRCTWMWQQEAVDGLEAAEYLLSSGLDTGRGDGAAARRSSVYHLGKRVLSVL